MIFFEEFLTFLLLLAPVTNVEITIMSVIVSLNVVLNVRSVFFHVGNNFLSLSFASLGKEHYGVLHIS